MEKRFTQEDASTSSHPLNSRCYGPTGARKVTRLILNTSIALAYGLGLMLVLLWLLSNPSAGLPVIYAADLQVCPSGCTYSTIQAAVDAASDGDVIKVATGTYTDTHTIDYSTQVVYVSKTVTIRGGYTTADWNTSDPAANPTTLDPDGYGRVIYIKGDISPTIEGLRLTGGTMQGGGIYVFSATATISNNHIFSNTGYDGGGGVYLYYSAATLRGNTIADNTSNYGGGGVRLNYSAATLSGNTITDNRSDMDPGGGLYLEGSDATLTNNVVADNQVNGSYNRGSGLYIAGSSPRLRHNTIARNSGGDGSAIYVDGHGGNYSTVWMTNTIMFSHTVGLSVTAGNTATLESTLWHQYVTDAGGAGTINRTHDWPGDPAFVNPDARDYHVGPTSAAINKGVDAGVTTDIDGDPRPLGAAPDLGADERPGTALPGLAITKVDKPDPVKPGRALTYTLTIANNGAEVANSLVITDAIPAHTSFISASHGGVESNGIVSWNAISLPTGASISRTFVVSVSGGLADGYLITNDPYGVRCTEVPAPTWGAAVTTLVVAPSLSISKVDQPDPLAPGGVLTYTLTIINNGGAIANNVVITDVVPADTSFVSASDGGTESGGIVTWNVPNLSSGASLNRTLAVAVSGAVPSGQIITNALYGVRCTQVPTPTWGPAVTTTAKIETAVDLQKWPSAKVIASSQVVTYSYLVTNTGTVVISNTWVVDDIIGFVGNTGQLEPGHSTTLIKAALVATDTTNTATALATSAYGSASASYSATVQFGMPTECPFTIQSVGSGEWNVAATWDLNRVPLITDVVLIQFGHVVSGPVSANVRGLCNYGLLQSRINQALSIQATEAISNYGQILGSNGSPGGATTVCGGPGSSLDLRGSPVYNEGTIQAGNGGSADECGGTGGSTMVYGRDTTNLGTICAGRGGNALGTAPGWGGDGGEAHIWGKWGGPGFLINSGLACGGDGGDGNPGATSPQQGGDGGRLKLISLPSVYLYGVHYAGWGGDGTGGGADGSDGSVFIEPNTISLAGKGAQVRGGNIIIFGGNGWTLDLSNMEGAAISATGGISLAVGSGGVVDLRGNADQVLQAGGQVMIASDNVSLDEGASLSDVAGPNAVTGPSQLLRDVSVTGPGQATVQPGATLSITLTVLNGGPESDTYTLSHSDSAGWSLTLPGSVTIDMLDMSDQTLTVTPPMTAMPGTTDIITITATSQADPKVVAVKRVEVSLGAEVYLPLIRKE